MTEAIKRVKAQRDTEMETVRGSLRILERDLPERHRWVVRNIIRQWIDNRETNNRETNNRSKQ